MIEIKNLSKNFETGFSLSDISLEINEGEKISLFGPNGAGKSTFLRILSCLLQPTSGQVVMMGYPLSNRIEILKRLGLAPQAGHFYENLTAKQNLEFYGKMYGIGNAALKSRIEYLLEEFGLLQKADHKVMALSKGMKQRMLIIKALLHDPQVLLLDEPYSGLDMESTDFLYRFLNAQSDKTIISATHDFETGIREDVRVIIFNNGSVIFDDYWKQDIAAFKVFYREVVNDDKKSIGSGI